MRNQKYFLLLPALWAFSSVSLAKVDFTPVSTTINVPCAGIKGSDVGYGGLKWTFGDSFMPEIVAGYRHAEINCTGGTQGGDISFSFKIGDSFQLDQLIQLDEIRLKYFNGANYLQGEVGAGYDFSKGFFAGVGVQGPYSNAGVDYHFTASSPFETYLMFNSLGIYNKPRGSTTTTLSCPAGLIVKDNLCKPGG